MITQMRDIVPESTPKFVSSSRHVRPISPEIVAGVIKLIDFFIVPLAAYGAFKLYIVGFLHVSAPFTSYGLASLIGAAAFVTGLNRVRAYDFHRLSSLRWQATRGFLVWLATASLLLGVAYVTKISSDYSRAWAVAWSLGAYGLFLVGRTGLQFTLRQWANAGRLARNIVVVGSGESACRLIAKKGLATGIQAFAKFHAKYPKAKFRIAGERLGDVTGGAVLKHSKDFNLVRECYPNRGTVVPGKRRFRKLRRRKVRKCDFR